MPDADEIPRGASGSRGARRRFALIAVGVVIAAPVAAAVALWALSPGTERGAAPVVGGALVSADGRSVSVTTALAPCGETDSLEACSRREGEASAKPSAATL